MQGNDERCYFLTAGIASFHDDVTVIRMPSGVRTKTRVDTPLRVSPGVGTPIYR